MHAFFMAAALAAAELFCLAAAAQARPPASVHEWAEPDTGADLVGDVDGTGPARQKALQDTVWIADWTFDSGSLCDGSGWAHVDNHIRNDGSSYWHIETGFASPAGVAGKSAAVGYHDDVCCQDGDGYHNDWYQAIRIEYTAPASMTLDYIVDSEAGYDFLQIETDSLCLSFARVDFDVDPAASAAAFRRIEIRAGGRNLNGEWYHFLSDYGPGKHCAYIAFFSDGGFSPCDGNQPATLGEGAVAG